MTPTDDAPSCAHSRVMRRPQTHSDGAFVDKWECEQCGAAFERPNETLRLMIYQEVNSAFLRHGPPFVSAMTAEARATMKDVLNTMRAVAADVLRASTVRIREEKTEFDAAMEREFRKNRAAGMDADQARDAAEKALK